MVKVIGVGDCMVDKNLTNGMMYPGGQALNIAVNTKLCGAPVSYTHLDVYKRQSENCLQRDFLLEKAGLPHGADAAASSRGKSTSISIENTV